MRLDRFSNDDFSRGASIYVEALWLVVSGLLVSSWIPGSKWRCGLLKLFGARIGEGVIIKPGVQIKYPWRLTIGSFCWIGERTWIDNLAEVRVGDHVCISQGVYLCTGSHDWSSDTFDLITGSIVIENGAWVGAFSRLAPGSVVGENAVLTLGSVGARELEANTIYKGNPARPANLRPNSMSAVAK